MLIDSENAILRFELPIITNLQMSVVPLKTTHLQQDNQKMQQQIQLRKLRKKIFKLTNQRKQKIDQIKRTSILKHIPINRKAQKIIEGCQFIQQNSAPEPILKEGIDIQNSNQKGGGSQKETKENQNQGICDYWKKVLVSQYKQTLKPHDLEYLEYLKSISVKEYCNEKTTLVFSFRSGHRLIDEGNYEKTITRNEQGEPTQYSGQIIPSGFKMKNGFCKFLFTSTNDIQRLQTINQLFQILCSEMIPNSLQYYLDTRLKENPYLLVGQKEQRNANSETTYPKALIN